MLLSQIRPAYVLRRILRTDRTLGAGPARHVAHHKRVDLIAFLARSSRDALARLVDLTLEGQANAPVGRYFVDPNAVDRAKAAMDRVSERAAERAFGGSETGGEDSASPYDASFARGVEHAASLREDEAEREARVRAELDRAGVIERQGEEGTRKRSGETENTKTLS